MKKVRGHQWKHTNQLRHVFKTSSALLLITMGLIGSQCAPMATAQEVFSIGKQPSLETYIQKSQAEVKKVKEMNIKQKAKLNANIGQSKSVEEINHILKEAHVAMPSLSHEAVDLHRQREDVRRETEKIEQNIAQCVAEITKSTNKVDRGELNNLNDDVAVSTRKLVDELNRKAPQASEIRNALHVILTEPVEMSAPSDHYVSTKRAHLEQFEEKLATEAKMSPEQKSLLKKEIHVLKAQLNNKNNLVLNRLNDTDDKSQAVKDLLDSMMNGQQAKAILSRIQIDGKTNVQIANQVVGQLDSLTVLSSDDLLRSMMAHAEERKALIEALLSTQFDSNKATKIANQILHDHPTNVQVVQRLKTQYGKNVTGDMILENVLDQADDKQQAIQTILASKFSEDKARILAERIVDQAHTKSDLMRLLRSNPDALLDKMLKVDNEAHRLKTKLQTILQPLEDLKIRKSDYRLLRGQSDLWDALGGFSKFSTGKSILDDIPDIPNPIQGRALSLVKPSDGFLSGLFDHEGNLDLPATGQMVKKSVLPVSIVLIIFGSAFIVRAIRRKSKKS
ncbi:hypothetical protein [Staphylococcus ratti]|uniref:Cell wall anchor protein n=1 Tax=Staphylococcus ratti TaxID=2892440 RepID=A0ABY3PCV3_9STAP|nr:hypothetical protein [Staphylococcus ratti]UEX90160.1 hypothetical protein LN051_00330 [Staphylococcus ratti]